VDDQGRVDYAAWQQQSIAPLQDWLQQMAAISWGSLSRSEQLTFWLNLYNALVIDQVLAIYPIRSIRPTWLGIPNWISFWRFFQRKIYQQGDQSYSLNDIEHGLIRPQFRDPRIHFALVCAAIGCPLLRNQAYRSDILDQQLDQDARRFINNPEKVYYQNSTLYCSKIFQWYQQDFIAAATSIPQFIQPYFVERSESPILTNTTPIRYLPYNWRLNRGSRI
jgi:hypothetical protein